MSKSLSVYIRFLLITFIGTTIVPFSIGKVTAQELGIHFNKDLPITLNNGVSSSCLIFSGNGSDKTSSSPQLSCLKSEIDSESNEYLPPEILDLVFSNLSFDNLIRYRQVSSIRQSFIDQQIKDQYIREREKLIIDFSSLLKVRKDPALVIEGALNLLNSFKKDNENFSIQLTLSNFDALHLLNEPYNRNFMTSKLSPNIFRNVQSLTLSSSYVDRTFSEGFDSAHIYTVFKNTGLEKIKKLVLKDNSSFNENNDMEMDNEYIYENASKKELSKIKNFKEFLNIFSSLEKFTFFNNKETLFLESNRIGVIANFKQTANLKKFEFQGSANHANSVAFYLGKWSNCFDKLDTLKWTITLDNASIAKINSPTTRFPALKKDSIRYKKAPAVLSNPIVSENVALADLKTPFKQVPSIKAENNLHLLKKGKRNHSGNVNTSAKKRLTFTE